MWHLWKHVVVAMLPTNGQQKLGEGVELLQGYVNQHQVFFEHPDERAEGEHPLLALYVTHAHVAGCCTIGCSQHRASHAAA